jgi:hypothetical protein
MNNNLDNFQNLVYEFQNILQNPDNFDLQQKVNQIKKMLTELIQLENKALTSQNIDDSFSAQELSETITTEIEQLKRELERAKKDKWTQFERQIFVEYTEKEIKEIQQLMTLWSAGTYSSVAESIIDHTYRKDYEDNYLEYLRDSAKFDKTKARRIPPVGFRDDDTVRWENLQTGEYLIQDNLGKIRTYGTN